MSGQVGTAYYTANPFEFDAQGVPLKGGQLFSFEFVTTTPFPTWQDPALTTPNTNPIIADGNGRFGSVWLSPAQSYLFQLFTAATPDNPSGSLIWSRGPFGPAAGGGTSSAAGIIGEVRTFAGLAASVPTQWQLCFGQAISRTSFAALFAVIGTTWGAGDGSTTFNLPDLRGRAMFGIDNMGGSPANRITSGASGISGVTLGASGGTEELQAHSHGVSDPTHNHTLTDPGHTHVGSLSNNFTQFVGSGGNVTIPSGSQERGGTINNSFTGITIAAAATNITLGTSGNGNSQNMPPAAMVNMIIFAGA
jgi:microcystin-dependent protein